MSSKKKILMIVSFLIVTLITCILIIDNNSIGGKNDHSNETISSCPKLSMRQIDGSLYNSGGQTILKNTVILFFSPDCETCESEIDEIITSFSDCNQIRWLFITYSFMYDETILFLKKHPIKTLDNSFVLLDNNLSYHNLFEVRSSPAIFIYDSNEKLIELKRGPMPIKQLKKILKKR